MAFVQSSFDGRRSFVCAWIALLCSRGLRDASSVLCERMIETWCDIPILRRHSTNCLFVRSLVFWSLIGSFKMARPTVFFDMAADDRPLGRITIEVRVRTTRLRSMKVECRRSCSPATCRRRQRTSAPCARVLPVLSAGQSLITPSAA